MCAKGPAKQGAGNRYGTKGGRDFCGKCGLVVVARLEAQIVRRVTSLSKGRSHAIFAAHLLLHLRRCHRAFGDFGSLDYAGVFSGSIVASPEERDSTPQLHHTQSDFGVERRGVRSMFGELPITQTRQHNGLE
jgi:hypothetical protein